MGSVNFPVEKIAGFAVGDVVQIESIAGLEKGRVAEQPDPFPSRRSMVAGFGSIVLECPSKFTHPSGSTITVLPTSTFYGGCEGNKKPQPRTSSPRPLRARVAV